MIEDIIKNYKNTCTRTGQFDIILNIWILLIVVFGFGGILAITIFVNLDNIVPDLFRMYLSFFTLIVIELIYIACAEIYIFKKEKKYIIKKITSLIEIEKKQSTRVNAQEKLEIIKEIQFKLKHIGKSNTIETIYNKIKFNEFLENSQINSKKVKSLKENINEYIKDKNNFKDIIDTAFWGLILLSVFNPIVDYIQSVYIPNTSSVFNSINILIYLVFVSTFIFLAFLTNHLIHKINDSTNRNERRLFLTLSDKLTNHKFETNDLESYINAILDN